MARRCAGKNFPGCDSCINKELDTFQCETCDDESNWEPMNSPDDDDFEELSIADFVVLVNGEFA
jgi:hypothetical protein